MEKRENYNGHAEREDQWFRVNGKDRSVGLTKMKSGGALLHFRIEGSTGVYSGTDIALSYEAAQVLRDLLNKYYPAEISTLAEQMAAEWEETKDKISKESKDFPEFILAENEDDLEKQISEIEKRKKKIGQWKIDKNKLKAGMKRAKFPARLK